MINPRHDYTLLKFVLALTVSVALPVTAFAGVAQSAEPLPQFPSGGYGVDESAGTVTYDDGTVVELRRPSDALKEYNERRSGSNLNEVQMFATGMFFEGVPYEDALKLRRHNYHSLIPLLNDNKWKDSWPNIVATMAIVGDESVGRFLIDYIERAETEDVDEHIKAKRQALPSLGYVVRHHGSVEVLDYLEKGLKPGFWQAKGVVTQAWSKASGSVRPKLALKSLKALPLQSAKGLALSSNDRAIGILEALMEERKGRSYALNSSELRAENLADFLSLANKMRERYGKAKN